MKQIRVSPGQVGRASAFLCLALCILLSLALPMAVSAQDGWQSIAEGIDYREFRAPGPNLAFVTRMDRSNPNVTLETSIAKQRLSDGKQTVTRMAEIYDGSLSHWQPTWGGTMDVVAAINGSFHDLETGVPVGGMMQGGWYAKRFDDLAGGSGFAWRLDRTAFIGNCVDHDPDNQFITFLDSGRRMEISGVNDRLSRGELNVYTHHWGARAPTGNAGTEVLVQMDVPAGILSWPDMAAGTIREIRISLGNSEIPFDHVVLTAVGDKAEVLARLSEEGARVGISYAIEHLGEGCEGHTGFHWQETYASLSGSFPFLQDGEIQSFDDPGATSRQPRTAICYNDDFLYFVVVDGRSERSVGMTMSELGEFCRGTLGADWGINQDGGGSSTLWLDGEVVNRPSDGSEREVANGLMMVVVKPPSYSATFQAGDRVRTTDAIDFSLGPGANYQTPSDVGSDQLGTILEHANGLGGVRASGQHWWLVDFDGDVGWAPEARLTFVERPDKETDRGTLDVNPLRQLLPELAGWNPGEVANWHHPVWLP